MSSLKPRPLSTALLNANRPNPQKSTCPRIAPSKAQARVIHGLVRPRGVRSAISRQGLYRSDTIGLPPEIAGPQTGVCASRRFHPGESSQKDCFLYERSHYLYENKETGAQNEPKTNPK
jgi:hypothetical protein